MLKINRAGAPNPNTAFGSGVVQSVLATPGWTVLGAFVYDWQGPMVLDSIVLTSRAGLTIRVRLFDLTASAEVAGSVLSSTATTEERITSEDLQNGMINGNMYQLQAECVGGEEAVDFGVIRYLMGRRST